MIETISSVYDLEINEDQSLIITPNDIDLMLPNYIFKIENFRQGGYKAYVVQKDTLLIECNDIFETTVAFDEGRCSEEDFICEMELLNSNFFEPFELIADSLLISLEDTDVELSYEDEKSIELSLKINDAYEDSLCNEINYSLYKEGGDLIFNLNERSKLYIICYYDSLFGETTSILITADQDVFGSIMETSEEVADQSFL